MYATTMAALPKDDRCHSGAQQETKDGEKHQQADGGLWKQVAACPAGWFEVLELAHPGGILVFELVLQVLH